MSGGLCPVTGTIPLCHGLRAPKGPCVQHCHEMYNFNYKKMHSNYIWWLDPAYTHQGASYSAHQTLKLDLMGGLWERRKIGKKGIKWEVGGEKEEKGGSGRGKGENDGICIAKVSAYRARRPAAVLGLPVAPRWKNTGLDKPTRALSKEKIKHLLPTLHDLTEASRWRKEGMGIQWSGMMSETCSRLMVGLYIQQKTKLRNGDVIDVVSL